MKAAAAWTGFELCPLGLPALEMTERLLGWFVDRQIASPDEEALASLIVTARRTFEDKVLETITSFLRRQAEAPDEADDRADGAAGAAAPDEVEQTGDEPAESRPRAKGGE